MRLSNNEATVTGPDGVAFFDALPLGTYSVYAFYAPNGQSGRLSAVALTSAGQQINRTDLPRPARRGARHAVGRRR